MPLYQTNVEISVESAGVLAAAKPKETVTEIVRDTQAVYSAGEGIVHTFATNKKDKKGKRALGARGVVAGLRFSCEDAAGLHATAQDEQATEVTNNAPEASAKELQATLEQESKKVQTRDGIAPEQQADLLLYQGDDKQFKDSPLKGYKAGYDQDNNKTYVNTQGTDVSRGGDLMGSVYHEAQRRTNASSAFLSGLSEEQQTNLAKLRGQQAGRTWNRLSRANRTSQPAANRAWNQRNQKVIQQNHDKVAAHGEVKPLILEHFDPRYRKAVAEGDTERAAELKAMWEGVEKGTVSAAVGLGVTVATGGLGAVPCYALGLAASTTTSIGLDGQVQQRIAAGDYSGAADQASYHLPFVGPSRSAAEAVLESNPLGAALSLGMLALDVLPLRKGRIQVPNASSSVQETAKSVKQWLSKGSRAIINDSGDLVLMSKDGLRKMRFDIKNPHGYPTHMHLQVLENGKWRDAIPGTHHLYPKQ